MTNNESFILTAAIISNHFDDITDRASLIDYATELDDDMTLTDAILRDALIRMIDLDLNDMLHNMNLECAAPLALIDTLDDDAADAFATFLLDNIDPAMIADALLAMHDDDNFNE